MNFKQLIMLFPLVLFMGCVTGGMVVNSGDMVSVQYSASVMNTTFDSGTISFVVSEHNVLPGLEAGIIGMRVGEVKEFVVPPGLGFGDYNEGLLIPLNRSLFSEEPKLYDQVKLQGMDGMVVNVSDEMVVVDLNHPLAGLDILFNVKLLTIERS